MSFIRKSVPPPEVKEGEVLEVAVLDVEYPVKGQYRDQVQFELEAANGYKFRSWMAWYEEPSDRSSLGKLAITFMDLVKGPFEKVDDVLEGIKSMARSM